MRSGKWSYAQSDYNSLQILVLLHIKKLLTSWAIIIQVIFNRSGLRLVNLFQHENLNSLALFDQSTIRFWGDLQSDFRQSFLTILSTDLSDDPQSEHSLPYRSVSTWSSQLSPIYWSFFQVIFNQCSLRTYRSGLGYPVVALFEVVPHSVDSWSVLKFEWLAKWLI